MVAISRDPAIVDAEYDIAVETKIINVSRTGSACVLWDDPVFYVQQSAGHES